MKIVYVADKVAQSGLDRLEREGYTVYKRPLEQTIQETRNAIDFKDVFAIILRATIISTEDLDSMPNLKIIARHGVGIDNIPVDELAKRQIRLTNIPGGNSESVAELAVALTLSGYRKLSENLTQYESILGRELAHKTVGIIGYGAIAQRFESIIHSFNVNILVYNHRPKEIHYGEQVSLTELLQKSDVISLHLPATSETTGIINEKTLELMKSSAYLVNTGRGQLIDSDALYQALVTNKISGAALDVFEPGKRYKLDDFFSLKNIQLTKHIGASTEENFERSVNRCVDEILLCAESKTAIHAVLN